jgi:nucleoside phosphorylase
MPFNIEVLSVGGNFDELTSEVVQMLNGVQSEFRFSLVPERFRRYGAGLIESKYLSREVFDLLRDYRREARGKRPYLIAVVGERLRSGVKDNLFGSRAGDSLEGEGESVVTLHDHDAFTESSQLYLCYYFIRYALSFVCPVLRNHKDTRSCFFDSKDFKPDLKKSMDSGAFCPDCTKELWKAFNEEINLAIQRMIEVMKALRANSQADLAAASLHGQVDIGIITIREDEFEAMLRRFPARRHVKGNGSDYEFSKVLTKANEEMRVVIARSPEQGQGAAQALASCMIADLEPRWIFLVGIAGGFPASEYTLGDVLLSQRMHDFAVTAAIENKTPEFQDMGGPMMRVVEQLVTGLKGRRTQLGAWSSKEFLGQTKPSLTPPKSIKNRSLYGSDEWKAKVVASLKSQFSKTSSVRTPDFFAAVIIAGNTLLKDTKLAELWRKTARHASGVEMELGGVCRAARYSVDGQTRVLAIRGVSDIVGYKRAPEWTDFACRSAAAFADALIRSGLIQRREE